MLRDDLLLFDDGRVSLFYAPFDHINPAAKLVLVGITPGRFQFWKALTVARDGLQAGRPDADVLRRVKEAASFSGPMRKNLVTMLDGIGLAQALRIETMATCCSRRPPSASLSSCAGGTTPARRPTC